MTSEVVLFLVARTGDDYQGAHVTLRTERCLDDAAAIIGCARRGTTATLRAYLERGEELAWSITASGRVAPCELERSRRITAALCARS